MMGQVLRGVGMVVLGILLMPAAVLAAVGFVILVVCGLFVHLAIWLTE